MAELLDRLPVQRISPAPLRALFIACGVTFGWLTVDVLYAILVHPHRLRLLTIYLLPLFAALMLFALWRLGRSAAGQVAPGLLLAGSLFHIAAAGMDLFFTTRADPYLTLEANPYIRTLLDETSHSFARIYGHVALVQVLFVGLFVLSWWSFLRHRNRIASAVHADRAATWPQFVKAATGGGHLTFRQWLLPLRPGEIPNAYYGIWPVALAVSFGTSLLRYWAAAEWLWIVPAQSTFRISVLLVGVAATLIAYFTWLAMHWRKTAAGR